MAKKRNRSPNILGLVVRSADPAWAARQLQRPNMVQPCVDALAKGETLEILLEGEVDAKFTRAVAALMVAPEGYTLATVRTIIYLDPS